MIFCEVYGIEENKIVIEMDEDFLRNDQKFRFEEEVYVIVSVIDTKPNPKINVVNFSHYRKFKKSSYFSSDSESLEKKKTSVRERFDHRYTPRKDVM